MRADAKDFVENETQFHLGFLPTEQPHPKTRDMDAVFARSRAEGARLLLGVDRDIIEPARRVFASEEFAALVGAVKSALSSRNGRIIFSGCGATGRLAVLLEIMWRRNIKSDRVIGVITGGDFALVRSVESFEDHCEFGREQVRELGVCSDDCFVAVSEGGETSSVIGSLEEACERGAQCFFVFNNPVEVLKTKIERSRRVLENPRITALELYSGPMALAGSTRMQATTFEMLTLGAALEIACNAGAKGTEPHKTEFTDFSHYAIRFHDLLEMLNEENCINGIAAQIALEEEVYRQGGLVTYYAADVLPDVFTDTTERTPTFMVPGFKKAGDTVAPPSWAFAKHRSADSATAWEDMLLRKPRCLEWTAEDYKRLGAPKKIIANLPAIGEAELRRFRIGCEDDAERAGAVKINVDVNGFVIVPPSSLNLMRHLAVKLIFNTVSTGTMARMGRIKANWMAFVSASNKKLIDRAIRLVSDLASVSYESAADAVFEAIEEINEHTPPGETRRSPVQAALEKLEIGDYEK